eukprot:9306024-Alexandrium_andersonii.AAC.1
MAADDRGVDNPHAREDEEDDVAWPNETGSRPPPGPMAGPTDVLVRQQLAGGSSTVQLHRTPPHTTEACVDERLMSSARALALALALS